MKSEFLIYVIFPSDVTTDFLSDIYKNLCEGLGSNSIALIGVEPSDQGYEEARKQIRTIPDGSLVVYMGHGSSSGLYGGEGGGYCRKFLYKIQDMSVFKNMDLVLLTCQSIHLIKSTFRNSKYNSAIGFGAIPTDIEEIESHARLREYEIDQVQIDEYKRFLVRLMSGSLIYAAKNSYSVSNFYSRLRFLISDEINTVILGSRNSTYADLLHYMKVDLDYF